MAIDEDSHRDSPAKSWYDLIVELGSVSTLFVTSTFVLRSANRASKNDSGFVVVEIFVIVGGIFLVLKMAQGVLSSLKLNGNIVRFIFKKPFLASTLGIFINRYFNRRKR